MITNKTTKKDMAALDASMASLKERGKIEPLKGPFTAGLVYRGLNCSPDHQVAVQEAYNSLPAIVRGAFEATGFHIEGCGSNIDMAARLDCEPPAMALGVTNYGDKLVMVAEYSFGPDPDTGKGIVVGSVAALSPFNTTLAHEIGHVLDYSCTDDRKARGREFINAIIADVNAAEALTKNAVDFKSVLPLMKAFAVNVTQPIEVFAESFAFAIGFGGTARGGADFAKNFAHSIEFVRGWFERNYDKFQERAAA